jgi:hypothetical protein
MALVAVLVLAVGVAGAFIGRDLLPPPDVMADLTVVEGTPSIEPDFSTVELGTEGRLLATGGELQPNVGSDNLDGDVISVGRIEGTDLAVFTWRMLNPPGSCVGMVSSSVHESTCSSPNDPAGGTLQAPWTVTRMGSDGDEPIDVIAVWRVPEGTSIVTVEEAGGTRSWQRPVAGIAAFTLDADLPFVTMEALSGDGSSLGRTGISPEQVASVGPPPEARVEGAQVDLVEITDSHPINQLLAEGLTSRNAFADAARADGLDVNCAAGGGSAEWELCLVAFDGALAVVPFNSEPGLVVRIGHPGLSGEVLVPLDTHLPVGIRYAGSQATVEIEYFGERIGAMSAPLPQTSD